MTDGIIQRAFRKYIDARSITIPREAFEQLQQELIEEIQKINHDAKTFREAKILQDYQDKLIGDNQE